jgi:hypothetical protein
MFDVPGMLLMVVINWLLCDKSTDCLKYRCVFGEYVIACSLVKHVDDSGVLYVDVSAVQLSTPPERTAERTSIL